MSRVFVVMGSDSDWPKVQPACDVLKRFGISHTVRVLSAHRCPDLLREAIKETEEKGTEVYIAAAGVAAHLAGVVAAHTTLPVIGIPIAAGALQGQDSLLAMVQMPPGIPVATVAIDGAMNAGLLAVQMLALKDENLAKQLREDRQKMQEKVVAKDKKLQAQV